SHEFRPRPADRACREGRGDRPAVARRSGATRAGAQRTRSPDPGPGPETPGKRCRGTRAGVDAAPQGAARLAGRATRRRFEDRSAREKTGAVGRLTPRGCNTAPAGFREDIAANA